MSSSEELEQYIRQWSEQPREHKPVFYDSVLWPEVRRRFSTLFKPTQTFDVLIIPVSNPYTAMLHIDHYRPQVVVFLYTERSRNENQAYIKAFTEELQIVYEEADPDIHERDPISVYQAVKHVYQHYPNKRIAVDITGGTKAMSVGVAMAGSLVGADSIYIESSFDKHIQDRYPGSEQPYRLPDPYAVLGDLEHAEAQRLFNTPTFDYSGAGRIWQNLTDRLSMPHNLRQHYHMWATLARAYAAWNAFDIPGAAHAMVHVVQAEPFSTLPSEVQEVVSIQQDIITHLVSMQGLQDAKGNPTLEVLQQLDYVLALLGSLYQNGQRRALQERFDMAALLLYRCLELISQRRLALYGILTHAPHYDAAQAYHADIIERYESVQQTYNRSSRRRGLPSRIPLFVGYMLLQALEDPLLHAFDIAQVQEQSRARNRSILAHGIRFIDADDYQAFADVVIELLQRFFAIEQSDIVAWQKHHSFINAI